MKILYFSATGNSLYAAKAFKGELLSIPQLIKENKYHFSDDKIGIVFPLHAWGVPSYVAEFLKKASFDCNYLFAVPTYGIYSGAVVKHLTELSNEAGYSFDYINKVKMVDNYLPTFDMEKEKKKEAKKKIEEQIAAIVNDVNSMRKWQFSENLLQKAAFNYMMGREKPFNEEKIKVHIYDEGIENYIDVRDDCNQCGVCESVCPVDNITMGENGKIVLSDKCFMCMACVHHCPSNAIRLNGEVSDARYRHKNIKLAEIIAANK